jgi:hypothetical protein
MLSTIVPAVDLYSVMGLSKAHIPFTTGTGRGVLLSCAAGGKHSIVWVNLWIYMADRCQHEMNVFVLPSSQFGSFEDGANTWKDAVTTRVVIGIVLRVYDSAATGCAYACQQRLSMAFNNAFCHFLWDLLV